jgi:CubicO group peptidase (beta-lactamase class C family)
MRLGLLAELRVISARSARRMAILLLLAVSLTACAATVTCASLKPALERSHIPDVAIAMFTRDGVRNLFCSSSGAALSPDAVFEAASLSKPVFALGVLTLVQEGKLDLDRPLATYLPHPYEHQDNPFRPGATDFVSDPRFSKITARMVLSHTSGLPNWSHQGPLQLQSDPGTRWSYSGEGYVYLQAVVETITHEPPNAFIQQRVLVPLGMVHSSFVWKSDLKDLALPGHTAAGATQRVEQYAKPVVSSTLYTTLGDYSKFVLGMLRHSTGSPFSLEEKKQVAVRPDLDLAWGLGVAIEDKASPSYFHWGANPGFQSFFMCQPKSGRGLLFLTNSDNGLDLVDKLVNASIPGPHPILRFPMLHPKD